MVTLDDYSPNQKSTAAAGVGLGFPANIEQHEADDMYLDGVVAAIAGKRAAAERLLRASLALEPERAKAWIWLAGIVGNPQQSIQYLEYALELSPGQPHIREGLEWARRRATIAAICAGEGSAAEGAVMTSAATPELQKRAWGSYALRAAVAAGAVACASTLYVLMGPSAGFMRGPTPDVRLLDKSTPSPTAVAALRSTPTSSWGEQVLADRAAIALSTEPVETSEAITPTSPVQAETSPELPATATPELLALRVTVVFRRTNVVPTITPTASNTPLPPTPEASPTAAVPPTVLAQATPARVAARAVPPTVLPQAVAHSAAATQPETVWNATNFRAPWYPETNPLTSVILPEWFLVPTIAAPTAKGKVIDVDLSEQMLRAYENGKIFMEVKVSTGLPGTPTVKGSYHIYSKYKSIGMSGPGYMLPNVPYTMFFFDGYSLHGTYWHKNFGHPMSHGCVNMKTEDAKKLFNWVEPKLPKNATTAKANNNTPGTLVVVHE